MIYSPTQSHNIAHRLPPTPPHSHNSSKQAPHQAKADSISKRPPTAKQATTCRDFNMLKNCSTGRLANASDHDIIRMKHFVSNRMKATVQ